MMNKILFICSGNVFRSQVAACLFNRMFGKGKAVSAGVRKPHYATVGAAMRSNDKSPRTIAFLKRKRIYIMKNIRRQVSLGDMKNARVIFVMERSQKRELAKRFPQFSSKILLLGEFAKQHEPQIVDPAELDLKTSTKAYKQIERALQTIKEKELLKSLS